MRKNRQFCSLGREWPGFTCYLRIPVQRITILHCDSRFIVRISNQVRRQCYSAAWIPHFTQTSRIYLLFRNPRILSSLQMKSNIVWEMTSEYYRTVITFCGGTSSLWWFSKKLSLWKILSRNRFSIWNSIIILSHWHPYSQWFIPFLFLEYTFSK